MYMPTKVCFYFQNKAVLIRPIAFRPTPVKDSSPYQLGAQQQQNLSHHGRLSTQMPQTTQQQNQRTNPGPHTHAPDFSPGHPLAKKSSKYFGSKI